jgi:hypothetical protein
LPFVIRNFNELAGMFLILNCKANGAATGNYSNERPEKKQGEEQIYFEVQIFLA